MRHVSVFLKHGSSIDFKERFRIVFLMSNVLTHHICFILSVGFYDFGQYFSSSLDFKANAPK